MDSVYKPVGIEDLLKHSAAMAPILSAGMRQAVAQYTEDPYKIPSEFKMQMEQAKYAAELARDELARQQYGRGLQKDWVDLVSDLVTAEATDDREYHSQFLNYANSYNQLLRNMADARARINAPMSDAERNRQAEIQNAVTVMQGLGILGKMSPGDWEQGGQAFERAIQSNPKLKQIDKGIVGQFIRDYAKAYAAGDDGASAAKVVEQYTSPAGMRTADQQELERMAQMRDYLAAQMMGYERRPDVIARFQRIMQAVGGQFNPTNPYGGPGAAASGQQPDQTKNMLHIGTADGEDIYVDPASYGGKIEGDKSQVVPRVGARPADIAAMDRFNAAAENKLILDDVLVNLARQVAPVVQQQQQQQQFTAEQLPPSQPAGLPAGVAGDMSPLGSAGLDAYVGVEMKQSSVPPETMRSNLIQIARNSGPHAAFERIMVMSAALGARRGGISADVLFPYVMKHLGLSEEALVEAAGSQGAI